jgi:hypothetical protein
MTLTANDQAIATALTTLTTQRDNMDAARRTVVGIQSEVEASFKCQAATVFSQKMSDWLTRWGVVRNAFEKVYDALSAAEGGITDAHDLAVSIGGHSYGVYTGLS